MDMIVVRVTVPGERPGAACIAHVFDPDLRSLDPLLIVQLTERWIQAERPVIQNAAQALPPGAQVADFS